MTKVIKFGSDFCKNSDLCHFQMTQNYELKL